jgi:glucokinase
VPLTLAVDLGGTNMRVAVVDEAGTIVDRDHAATPPDADALDPFVDLLLKMRTSHDVEHGVVAVPGRVDNLSGTLLHAPNLPPRWVSLITRDALERSLDLPVTLANDADAAAVGEAHFGGGRGHPDVVYLTISTGVGAGALVGGRLVLPRCSAGEIGHTVIDRQEAAAGKPATVEALGSGTAIGRLAERRGMHVRGPDLGTMVRDGDLVAREIWDEALFVASLAAVNLAHLFAPTVLVIGGGVGLNADLTLPPIIDALARFGPAGPPAEVVRAVLGDDPGLLGAAGWRAATGA